MITIKFEKIKGNFFDREVIAKAMDAATKKALSKFGAFVRTRARTSIRKRKKASSPGSPPNSHVGLLKKFLFFSWDASTRTVVIGPARLDSTVDPASLSALEYGEASSIEELQGKQLVRRTITIKARPFMGPAFRAELPGLAERWKNSIQKS